MHRIFGELVSSLFKEHKLHQAHITKFIVL
jgi:hypothetical protein